jgi:hypothetical protein
MIRSVAKDFQLRMCQVDLSKIFSGDIPQASLLKAPLHYFVRLAQNTYMPNCQDSSSQKLLVFETAWLAPTML